MTYATEEAKKLATNSARYACVDDSTVFGWAIHYFKEDSIEGKLYNLDGTEYKLVTKTTPKATSKQKTFTAPTTPKVEPPKPKQEQGSFWDLLDTPKNIEQVKNNTVDNSAVQCFERNAIEQTTTEQNEKAVIQNDTKQVVDCTNTTATTLENIHIDTDTGEVLEDVPTTPQVQQTPTFDRETLVFLATLLDDKIDIAWSTIWKLKRLKLSLNIF